MSPLVPFEIFQSLDGTIFETSSQIGLMVCLEKLMIKFFVNSFLLLSFVLNCHKIVVNVELLTFRIFLGEKSRLFFQSSETPSIADSEDDSKMKKEIAQTSVQMMDSKM